MTQPGTIPPEWPRLIWSEARQVTALNGWPPMAGDDAPPPAFFRALRAQGRDREAALFLAQSLPRFEAIQWAAAVIAAVPAARPSELAAALGAVDRWLADPAEANRRAARDAAGSLNPPTAVALCALAVFHAGGSLLPPDQPPAAPPRGATARFAGAAVIAAAALAPDPAATLALALDQGERIATAPQEIAQ